MMQNLKTKAMLMGGLAFFSAILVVTTLFLANRWTDQMSGEKLVSLNQKLNQNLDKAKTAVASFNSDVLGDFSVCSYNKTNSTTGAACNTTDEATIYIAYPGTYTVKAEIERGCDSEDSPQLQENFNLIIGDKTYYSADNAAETTCIGHNKTTETFSEQVTFTATGTQTVKLEHASVCADSTGAGCTPESVTVSKLEIDDGNEDVCSIQFTDSAGNDKETFNLGEKIYAKININDGKPGVALVYYVCGDPDNPSPTEGEFYDEASLKAADGSVREMSFSGGSPPTKTGAYWCVVNLLDWNGTTPLNPTYGEYSCGDHTSIVEAVSPSPSPATPTCTLSFDKSSYTVGETGKFSFTTQNYSSTQFVYLKCDQAAGGQAVKVNDNLNVATSGTIDWTFDSTYYAAGETEKCNLIFYQDEAQTTKLGECSSASVSVTSATLPTCDVKFTESKTDDTIISTANKGETKGFWSTVSGFVKTSYDAWWSCDKQTGGEKFDDDAFVDHGWTGNDWIFNYAGAEKCSIFFTKEGGSPTVAADLISMCETDTVTVAEEYSCTGTTPSNSAICSGDGEGLTADTAKTLVSACTTATKCEYACVSGYKYDSTSKTCKATVNGSCGTASKTYSSSSTSYGSDTFCTAGTASPSSPAFPSEGSSTSWTCQGSNGGVDSSCQANRSSEVIDGKCGDADGRTYSSSSDFEDDEDELCSAGNDSSISGSGPWYWSCDGVNGGTSESCGANKSSISYSPTVTVIPVTEYTYSYTAKAAPASGTATNIALMLSVSAMLTLGVWVALKKIKG